MSKIIPPLLCLLIACICPLEAEFYVKTGTGISVPLKAEIHAPAAVWDPSPQGYNGSLGSKFLLSAGIGYDFPWMFSMDASGYYRLNYRYRHFQTSDSTTTPGFLGNKTRIFDLNIATFMVNATFSGRGVRCFNWNFGIFPLNIYPFIGFGVGGNQHTLYNFRSVDLATVDETCQGSTPSLLPSYAAENPYTERFNFAFQFMAGLEAKFCNSWAVTLGYRWFDAGTFRGPQFIRNQCGIANDLGPDTWKISIAAHEFFLEIKAYL